MPLPSFDSIASSRMTLRGVEPGDLPDLMDINGDPQVTHFLPYATWQSAADGAAWLSRMEALEVAGTGKQLVLVRQADAKVIGTMLFFSFDEQSARLQLGYTLARACWGKGLMREAVDAACRHAFGRLGIRRIEAEVNPANLASCQVLLRSGFVHEGTLRQRWFGKGAAYDTNMYGLLQTDWQRKP